MSFTHTPIERALRLSGILLILGIAVEVISLLWEKPLSFLLFVGVGGLLTLIGILLFLYSVQPSDRSSSPHP